MIAFMPGRALADGRSRGAFPPRTPRAEGEGVITFIRHRARCALRRPGAVGSQVVVNSQDWKSSPVALAPSRPPAATAPSAADRRTACSGDQPAERLTVAGAAADMQVVAFDHVVALLDLGGEQADVGDVVLRAGMMAAGQMDVERLVDGDARFQPIDQFRGVALGVAGGELAAGVAGAGDQPAAERRGSPVQAERRRSPPVRRRAARRGCR